MPDAGVVEAAKSDENSVTVIAAARNRCGWLEVLAITNWRAGGEDVPRRWPCQYKSWNEVSKGV